MYKTIKEITTAFIKQGWNKDTTFTELTPANENYKLFEDKINKGRKYFVMNITGNIFDDKGEIALYNIKPMKTPVSISPF